MGAVAVVHRHNGVPRAAILFLCVIHSVLRAAHPYQRLSGGAPLLGH
jgi:hypothetical protein